MNAQPIRGSRWIGRVLHNKWRIDARLARGGMGTVFAATHKNNGSTAAIKVLHPEFARDRDTRSRFIQEGYAANQVNHPGVVRIIDDDETEEGFSYLVMELLEGELLEERRIRLGGKLPVVEVYEVAEQLLDVLAAAHGNGIVHRDVKPENIFLTRQGRLKVLDFGFARMKTGLRTENTATGFLLGTPGFMSPEQATGSRDLIDAQTDIWAVGATLFLLLTGRPVHDGESAAELLVAAANEHVVPIGTLSPELPAKLKSAVDRAVAFDKAERWLDAKSMQIALRLVPGRPPLTESGGQRFQWGIVPAAPAEGGDVVDLTDPIEELDSSELLDQSESIHLPLAMRMAIEERRAHLSTSPNDGASRAASPAQMEPLDDGGQLLQPSLGGRVLTFLLIAGATTVIVILTGLLVILASD